MTQVLQPVPIQGQLLSGGGASVLPGIGGVGSAASASDVQRFEQAMRQGLEAPGAVGQTTPPPAVTDVTPAASTNRLGDAILGSLGRLSSMHHDTRQQVGQVLSAPDAEFTPRRMLEVQAALGEQSVVTQFVAGVSTQLTRLIDQTVKMQ